MWTDFEPAGARFARLDLDLEEVEMRSVEGEVDPEAPGDVFVHVEVVFVHVEAAFVTLEGDGMVHRVTATEGPTERLQPRARLG